MPTINDIAGRVLPPRIWNAVKSVAGYRVFYRQTASLASGVVLRVRDHPDWSVFTEIFVDGAYDTPILDAIHAIEPERPLIALDLGANAGFFTLRLVDRLRRIRPDLSLALIAVEAGDRPASKFATRVFGDNALQGTVQLVRGLVGKRTGVASFSQYPATTNNTVHDDNLAAKPVEYIDLIPLVPPTGPIDLIKCDIEGSELDFLLSYPELLSRTRHFVIELHDAFVDYGDCEQALRNAGLEQRTSVPSGACRVDYWIRPSTSE